MISPPPFIPRIFYSDLGQDHSSSVANYWNGWSRYFLLVVLVCNYKWLQAHACSRAGFRGFNQTAINDQRCKTVPTYITFSVSPTSIVWYPCVAAPNTHTSNYYCKAY